MATAAGSLDIFQNVYKILEKVKKIRMYSRYLTFHVHR